MKRNMKQWVADTIAAPVKQPLPVLSFPAVQLMGITVRDLISSSDHQAQGMKLVADRVPSAASVSLMDLSVEAECFGSTIRVSDDEVPTVIGSIVSDEDDRQSRRRSVLFSDVCNSGGRFAVDGVRNRFPVDQIGGFRLNCFHDTVSSLSLFLKRIDFRIQASEIAAEQRHFAFGVQFQREFAVKRRDLRMNPFQLGILPDEFHARPVHFENQLPTFLEQCLRGCPVGEERRIKFFPVELRLRSGCCLRRGGKQQRKRCAERTQ